MAPSPMDGRTVVQPISSLIASLPNAGSMHRTVDQFYDEAHSSMDNPAPNSILGHSKAMGNRLGYFCIFVALGLANVGDAAEIGSMGFLLAHYDFRTEIVQGHDGLVAAALYVGMLVGGIVAGPLCDMNGRRSVLLYGLFLNSGFGIGAVISATPWQLILCRLCMGFGIGSVVSCLLALTSEHTPPRHRGFYLNFVSSFWTIGSIYVAAMAWVLFGKLNRSWRLYFLVNALPSIVSFCLVLCFVPESARFFAIHGKHERATKVANRIASSMGYDGNKLKVSEIQAHYPQNTKGVTGQHQPLTFREGLSRSCTNFSSLYQKETRGRTCGVQMLWFFVSFGSGICLWVARVFTELSFVSHVYAMTLFFSLSSVPGVFVAGYIMDKMGRTALLTTTLVLTTSSLALFAALTLYTDIAWLVVLSACIFHSCLVLCWSALSVVTAETFNTNIRSTAMGVCAASGRFASILVHLAAAPLMDHRHPSVLLLLGTACFALGAITSIVTALQNKTGQPLPDCEAPVLKANPLSKRTAETART